MTIPYASLLALFIASWAMVTDIWHRRIDNALIVAGLLIALLWQIMRFGVVPGALACLSAAGTGFLLFIPGYLCKQMGAGDVKLAMALSAFFTASQSLLFALLAYIAGGMIAMGYIIHNTPMPLPAIVNTLGKQISFFFEHVLILPPINTKNRKPNTFPFAAALAAATWYMVLFPER